MATDIIGPNLIRIRPKPGSADMESRCHIGIFNHNIFLIEVDFLNHQMSIDIKPAKNNDR